MTPRIGIEKPDGPSSLDSIQGWNVIATLDPEIASTMGMTPCQATFDGDDPANRDREAG